MAVIGASGTLASTMFFLSATAPGALSVPTKMAYSLYSVTREASIT
jgi:hypothetical protein